MADAASSDPTRPIAKLLGRLIEAGVAARKSYMDTREEIKKYAYDKDFSFLYQDMKDELFFKAKIAKAAEFLEIMGAALYPTNPKALVQSAEFATPTQRERHKIEEKYADFAFRQGDLQTHGTRMVYEALLGGRGVLWTGYNGRKGVVQSVFDDIANLILDPDARHREELNWITRRRVKPRWTLLSMHPDKAKVIKQLDKFSDTKSSSKTGSENASELIEYHEFYSLVPLHNYAPSMGEKKEKIPELIEGPAKYTVCGDHLIAAEPWEVNWFDIDSWPCDWYDPLEKPGCLWPSAPLETSLGHIKALNWIYTLYLSKMRVTTRTALVVMTQNGQGLKDDQILKLLKGKDMEVVKITVNGNQMKLSDFVQQFKFDTGVEEFERFATIVGQAFEKASGLYDVLYTGTTPTQIRNATTANMIQQSSHSRINNMQARMEQFMGRLTQRTLFAARYIEGPEEIGRKFGPQAATLWGTLAPPEAVAEERAMREQTKQIMVQQAMMPPPMPVGPVDPMAPPPMPPDPAVVAQDAEAQLGPEQLVDMAEWVNDASRQIAAGSMRPLSPQQQVDNLNVALNQLAPAVATVPGGVALVAAIAKEFAKVNQYSRDFQDATEKFAIQAAQVSDMQVQMASMPPPPPSPPPPPAPTSEGTPEKGPKSGPEGGTPTI